jgi:hypothetical protein
MSYTFRGITAPDETLESLKDYVEHGLPPGDFLHAVLSNDLRRACAFADERNLPAIPALSAWVYNEAPMQCWGSPEIVRSWILRMHEERESANKESGTLGYYVVNEKVEGQKDPQQHLVSAKNSAAALRAVTEPRFTVAAATTEDAIALTAKGVKVTEAGQ